MTASQRAREDERRLGENLAAIRERIAAAASRSGRSPASVRLVGVTKYVDASLARLLADGGLCDLGESRPQELWAKAAALADLPVRWHLIGHLQRNKIRRTLPLFALLHSADSLRLLGELDREGMSLGSPAQVLIEVNVSGDAAKHGAKPEELERLLIDAAALPSVRVRGLMTMAALEGGVERARRDFAALRDLRECVRSKAPLEVDLAELSMGMSGDYEAAIEEGATIVRVGSALFENLTPAP